MEKINLIVIFIALILLLISISGCRTTPVAGDESLVQARIQHAVDAERNRWITGLSQQITDGLGEADRRIAAIADGQRATFEAAREYRLLVLAIIDRLQHLENQESEVDQESSYISINNWNADPQLDN